MGGLEDDEGHFDRYPLLDPGYGADSGVRSAGLDQLDSIG